MDFQLKLAVPLLSKEQVLETLKTRQAPYWPGYHAYFSTWLGGIVTDPALMLVPMDDHMVHRGDAVFEAIKVATGRIFLLEQHLERLEISASRIGLKLPFSLSEIKEIILQTLRVVKQQQVLIRLFISRGPGSYGTNPADCPASQMYLTVTSLRSPEPENFEAGVRIGRSQIPVKDSWMAQVKSCNYLPNVMMKKESVERNLHFTVSFDRENFLAESSTENIVIVDSEGILTMPQFQNILKGTTMLRVFDLAKSKAHLATAQRNISEADLLAAREVMMIGTTLDVLPVTFYENQKIFDGQVGPVAKKLRAMLQEDFKLGIPFE